MKNSIKLRKGLSLNKETLSKINDQQMRAIAGGTNKVATTTTGTQAAALAGSDCCSYTWSACC